MIWIIQIKQQQKKQDVRYWLKICKKNIKIQSFNHLFWYDNDIPMSWIWITSKLG